MNFQVSVDVWVEFQNTAGLSQRYNEFLDKGLDYSAIGFVHDDWLCNDFQFFDKVYGSKFDVIGVVGGLRYSVPLDWETRPYLWTEAAQGKASGFV